MRHSMKVSGMLPWLLVLLLGAALGCSKSSSPSTTVATGSASPSSSGDDNSKSPAEGASGSNGGALPEGGDWFPDATTRLGIDFVHESGATGEMHMPEVVGGGLALLDGDGDGDLDAYFINGGPNLLKPDPSRPAAPNRYFRNDGDRFVDATKESGLGDESFGMGVAVGDVDNDGDVDVFVTNFGPDRLFLNNGKGVFRDVTEEAGIHLPAWSTSAAFFDYDLDGDLDLYVDQYVVYLPERECYDPAGHPDYCGPMAFVPERDVLLRNDCKDGKTKFTDVSAASGITAVEPGASLGVVIEDFNDDGRPDVYTANDGYENHLWTNQPDGTFLEEAMTLGAALNMDGHAEAGMGVVAFDYDNDGLFDLFMTHLRQESNTLYKNLGGVLGFDDVTGSCGLSASSMELTGFGVAAFDIDLDGFSDLIVANGRVMRGTPIPECTLPAPWNIYGEPNLIYMSSPAGRFRLANEMATTFTKQLEISRGLAYGDIDNDGDIDMALVNVQGPARVYLNEAPRQGHWLRVEALDPRYRRHGIGARVTLTIGDLKLMRTVSRAGSYAASNDPRAHFGIPKGSKSQQARLVVRWLDGLEERFEVDAFDAAMTVRRGEGKTP